MKFEDQIDRYLEHYPESSRDAVYASRLLFRGAHLLEQHINQALQPLALEMRQYIALVVIQSEEGQVLKPSDMCVSLNATRVQITRLLDQLEKRDWITRTPSQQDRRSQELNLTPAGVALLKLATPKVHQAYQSIWGMVRAEDMTALQRSLSLLNHTLNP